MRVREYRRKLVEAGQSSPAYLCHWVIQKIANSFYERPISILDVGCGLGHQMTIIRSQLQDRLTRVEGLDWSPATYEFHQGNPQTPYDCVNLAQSDQLPYKDGHFDLVLSMENMEHLYSNRSIQAIAEMSRIATHIMITTPTPEEVINKRWIIPETFEAILDNIPLSRRDYICLESAVHKSILFPQSMINAGFEYHNGAPSHRHSYFFGKSACIDVQKIVALGIEDNHGESLLLSDGIELNDYRYQYVRLLAKSLMLDSAIRSHPLFR